MKIYKYALPEPGERCTLALHKEAQICLVGHDPADGGDYKPTLWAIVDPEKLGQENRQFMVVGTGWEISQSFIHRGSYIHASYVWHVLEIV